MGVSKVGAREGAGSFSTGSGVASLMFFTPVQADWRGGILWLGASEEGKMRSQSLPQRLGVEQLPMTALEAVVSMTSTLTPETRLLTSTTRPHWYIRGSTLG